MHKGFVYFPFFMSLYYKCVLCTYTISCISTHLQDGWTPLFIACQKEHVPVVEHLIAAKADINHQDEVDHVLHVYIQFSITVAQHNCVHCFAMTAATIT